VKYQVPAEVLAAVPLHTSPVPVTLLDILGLATASGQGRRFARSLAQTVPVVAVQDCCSW
jgi:hypothetical protein